MRLVDGETCRRVYSYLRLDRAPHKCEEGFGIGVLAPGWDPMSAACGVQSGDAFTPNRIPGCQLFACTDTSAFPTAVVFPEVATTNAGFEGAAGPPPAGWTDYQGVSTRVAGTRTGGTGSYVCQIDYDGSHASGYTYNAATGCAAGNTYSLSGWARGDGTSWPRLGDGGAILWTGTASTDWQYFDVPFGSSGTILLWTTNLSATHYVQFDELVMHARNVSQLTDLNGTGHHLLQATAAKQQLWVPTGCGGIVRGDGLARYFAANYAGNQPRTRYLLAKVTVQASARTMLDGLAANSGALLHKAGSTTTQANAGSAFDGPALTDATWQIFRLTLNGAASNIAINGGAPTVGDAGAGNPAGLTLGAAGGGASGWTVQDSAMVADYAGVHDLATAARIERYMRRLAARLSVPVP